MKRIMTAMAIVLALVGVQLMTQSPALANYDNCPTGLVCLYDGPDGTGTLLFHEWHSPGTCWNLASSVNDRADSFYVRLGGGKHAQFYWDANCAGHRLHDVNLSSGPFANRASESFIYSNTRGHWDRNRATSVFYNAG